MRVADEAELGLRHFSASTLHSNTCDEEDGGAAHGGGKKRRGAASHADEGPACAMEHSLDWMQEPLTLRISAVVKASCVNASTAAAGSEQWLVAKAALASGEGSSRPLQREPVGPDSPAKSLARESSEKSRLNLLT